MQVKVSGLDSLAKCINDIKSDIESYDAKFDNMINNSKNIASNIFDTAPNTSNATTSMRVDKAKHEWTIVASGTDVLFIEFGTGITYPDIHPLASKMGYTRGGYKQGKGKYSSWNFVSQDSISGGYVTPMRSISGSGTMYSTHGQPASMPMEKAFQNIETELKGIIK